MHITEVNEGSRILELSFHEEILDTFRLVESGLFNHSFNFLKVSESGACFDVFEIDIRIIGLGKNIAQEQEKTFVGSKLL